jgi:hypothetical protein
MGMRDFRPGEKVAFLNEKGGGVVVRLKGKDHVVVTLDEGFDVEMHASQLVRLQGGDPLEDEPQLLQDEMPTPVIKGLQAVILHFVPLQPVDPVKTSFELLISNLTSYDFLYSLYAREFGSDLGLCAGWMKAGAFATGPTFKRDAIEKWSSLNIRMMWHADGMVNLPGMREKKLQVSMKQLSNASVWKKGPDGRLSHAIQVSVGEDEKDAMNKRDQGEGIHFRIHEQYGYPETDLHIHELVEDTRGLTNYEMLKIQVQHFEVSLSRAMQLGHERIVFIHGVGNGVLKNEITKRLRSHQGVRWEDAPMRYYGTGATVVFMKG